MRAGFFRRLAAFLLDASPMVLVLIILVNLFVGDFIVSNVEDFMISEYENYEEDSIIYQENWDTYNEAIKNYEEQYESGEITEEQYAETATILRDQFYDDNAEFTSLLFTYYTLMVLMFLLYFSVSFGLINYFYHLMTKGQTIGRKLMNLELAGRINWLSLLLREFLWKTIFWTFTFSIGIFIDVILIAFTTKKKTLRDHFSETQIIISGTQSYPF